MPELTPEEKAQAVREKAQRQRAMKKRDLDRYYRHPNDGPLVGWPDQDVLDRKHKNNVMLTICALIFVIGLAAWFGQHVHL